MVPCAEAKRGGMACVSARRRAPPRPPPFTADFDAAAARAAADRVASRRLARGPPPSTIHAVQRGRSPQRKQAEARAAARHAAEAACATEDALYDTEPTVWGSETVHGAHLVLPPPDAPRRPAGAARTGRTWRDVDALARAWERYAADTAIVRLVERSAAALPPYAAAAHAITELRLAAAETIMAGAPRRAVDDALAPAAAPSKSGARCACDRNHALGPADAAWPSVPAASRTRARARRPFSNVADADAVAVAATVAAAATADLATETKAHVRCRAPAQAPS